MAYRRIVLVLGGGPIAEAVALKSVEAGSTVVYGHTTPLETVKEKSFLTPYSLDTGSYESHLAVWQGAINRHQRVDEVILCLSDVHDLIKTTKIGLYYWRRGYLGEKPRIVFLSTKGESPLELANGHSVVGMYRSLMVKFNILKVRADLVCAYRTSDEKLVIDALQGKPISSEESNQPAGDTVYVIEGGNIRAQSPLVGQVAVAQYILLGYRLAGAAILSELITKIIIRHGQLANRLQMKSVEFNAFVAKGIVGICAILYVGGQLGSWGGLVAGWAMVMAV